MQSKITEIIKKIEGLQKDLRDEYEKLLEKYGYDFKKGKITFLDSIRKKNIKFKANLFKYVFTAGFKQILSIPFIYSMLFPIILLDIFLWIYQNCAFPLYGIPKAKRSDFILFDRQFLDYLNMVQKVNCIYCTYANGLFSYAVEVASRTERYWCPVKAARTPNWQQHQYYKDFADYGDPKGFFEVFNQNDCFDKLPEENSHHIS
jgi:hypothetical protein